MSVKIRHVKYVRGNLEKSLVCRGCTQDTKRAILCKPADSPQYIISPFCDQCFDTIKQLPTTEIDIKIIRPS